MTHTNLKLIIVLMGLLIGSYLQAQDSIEVKEEKIYLSSITPNLMVENIDETIAFYVSKLGFKVFANAPDTKPYF
jgi:catechol-2,3-dioxygenase